jgi:hypothetical protein
MASLTGDAPLRRSSGESLPAAAKVALCRCGASKKKAPRK